MTKCRYLLVFSALVFITVNGTAATSAEDKPQCPLVGEACTKAHTPNCHYEFTVQKDNGGGSLDVKHSEYVFAVTDPKKGDDAQKKKEKDYVDKVKDKTFTISAKPGTTVVKGKTYEFTRCPDSLYERGAEVDPKRDSKSGHDQPTPGPL